MWQRKWHLDRLPQVAGRILGNPLAGLGDGDQLGLAGGVLLLGRHLPSQLRVAMRQADDGLHDDERSLVEVELGGVRKPHLEGHLALLDLLDHARETFPVDPGVVQVASPARPAEEVDDQTGVIRGTRIEAVPLLEDLERPGLQRTLLPVLERPLVRLPVLRGRRLLDGVLRLHPIHVPFRIRVDAVDGTRHATHEEVVVDVQLLPLQQGRHELGSADDLLVAGSVLVHLGHDANALEVDLLRRAPELLLEPIDARLVGRDAACGTLRLCCC